MGKLTKDNFIEKAREIHSNKYDYSKVVYQNNYTKVYIICPEHGEFLQTPNNHLNGNGCPKCGKINGSKTLSLAQTEFINRANSIHSCIYDYSKVNYQNMHTKICIICLEHGEFWQTPHNHLMGHGCPKCGKLNSAALKTLDNENFIQKAIKIHGNRYSYDNIKYKNNHTKICIVCPIHGKFWQMPYSHLNGNGCPKCHMSHLETETMNLLIFHNIKYEAQKRFDWLITQQNKKMSLDFFLPDYNVAIECQGMQHYNYTENGFFTQKAVKEIIIRDTLKRRLCEEHGIQMHYIKYNENVKNNIDKLLSEII